MSRQIHDKGYKRVLTKKKHFIHLIRKYIDVNLGEAILEEELELIDKAFIPKDFKEKEADVIYKAKLKGQEVIFYVLLELQSTVDYTMPFRLLIYMTELQKRIFTNVDIHTRKQKDFRLPPVVPIVLYNGQKNWNVARSFGEYTKAEEVGGAYTIDFEYFFLDLKKKTTELLTSTNTLIDNVFILDQASDTIELKLALEIVFRRMKALNKDEQIDLLDWIKDVLSKKVKNKKLVEEAFSVIERGDVKDMTYAIERIFDKEYAKALQKGREQGIEKGIEQGKREAAKALIGILKDEVIAEKIGLKLEEVKRLH